MKLVFTHFFRQFARSQNQSRKTRQTKRCQINKQKPRRKNGPSLESQRSNLQPQAEQGRGQAQPRGSLAIRHGRSGRRHFELEANEIRNAIGNQPKR